MSAFHVGAGRFLGVPPLSARPSSSLPSPYSSTLTLHAMCFISLIPLFPTAIGHHHSPPTADPQPPLRIHAPPRSRSSLKPRPSMLSSSTESLGPEEGRAVCARSQHPDIPLSHHKPPLRGYGPPCICLFNVGVRTMTVTGNRSPFLCFAVGQAGATSRLCATPQIRSGGSGRSSCRII